MENHYISVDNRERITVSQVTDVEAFDEETLWANLREGALEINGEKLNIESLDISTGMLVVTGRINAVIYTDKNKRQPGGFLRRITGRNRP